MSQETFKPNKAYFTESGALLVPKSENPDFYEAQRKKIGKTRLNVDKYVDGKSQGGKEFLEDSDVREITVALIDEKMLDLEEGGTENTANLKARIDLRDMKLFITSLEKSSDLSYFGAASDEATKLVQQGKQDEANVATAAADLLRHTGDVEYEQYDYSIDDPDQHRRIAKSIIVEHNDRVSSNAHRLKDLQVEN